MKKLILVLLVVFFSCEKDYVSEPELCNCPRTEFHGELYVLESIGSNCSYEYSYKGIISIDYNSSIDVILLTNKCYKEKSFVFKIGNEDEKIIKL